VKIVLLLILFLLLSGNCPSDRQPVSTSNLKEGLRRKLELKDDSQKWIDAVNKPSLGKG